MPTPSCRAYARSTSTRSEYGPIDGADVVDWPVQYDELEPYYAVAEELIGVAGDASANPFASWRSGEYPMPPGADMYGAILTTNAAADLGLHPYRAPTGVNSVEYGGRPACNNCGFCGNFGCPIDAKGDPVAPLRSALGTGRCEVVPNCYVDEVLVDTSGRTATGVRVIDTETGSVREIRARYVVLAAGAFETPRLMLRSNVGNSSGLVGRYLMYHFQTFVVGSFDHRLHGYRGRSVTHLHDDHLVPDADSLQYARERGLPYFRGGIVEHGGGGHPVMEGMYLPQGRAHTHGMLESMIRDKLWAFTMQGEDLPQPQNRVDLDPGVRDVHGRAAGRVTYEPHTHDLVASEYAAAVLDRVMRRAGAQFTFTATSPPLPGSRRRAPESGAELEAHHGHDAYGDRPHDERVRSVAAQLGRAEPLVRRLVGVPDVDRLRPDAHDRRARHPHGVRARRPPDAALVRWSHQEPRSWLLIGTTGRG